MEFELEDDPIPTEGEEHRSGRGEDRLKDEPPIDDPQDRPAAARDQAVEIPEQEVGRNG